VDNKTTSMINLTNEKELLRVNNCLSAIELEKIGIYPNGLKCYNYSFGILYKKGNQRIILLPLSDNRYKVVRTYDLFD